MQKRLLLINGKPGTGKTTALLKTVEDLKAKGYAVGGMISREVRSSGMRVGFEILDLNDGRKGWLAHVNQKEGPRVGKYRVNLSDLNEMGVHAIADAVERADVIAIDEIGPMELHSEKFKDVIEKAVESTKLVISTIHWRAKNRLLLKIRRREDAKAYTLTYENRDEMQKKVVEEAVEYLQKRYQLAS